MRNKFFLLFIVLAMITTTAVLAGRPARIRGESAVAVFHYDHPNGCTTSDAYVYVLNNKAYREGDPLANASYVEIIYEVFGQPTGEPASDPVNCDGLWYYEISGTGPLGDGDFSVADGLESAVLDTTINVWEGEAGFAFDLDIYVVWTATGKPKKHSRQASAIFELPNFTSQYVVLPLTTTDASISRVR